ncbi:hypothetical protein Hanom_Chr08g00683731 [Helianthus anomalus]
MPKTRCEICKRCYTGPYCCMFTLRELYINFKNHSKSLDFCWLQVKESMMQI